MARPICTTGWGRDEIDKLVICGIQTNVCCETTARVGSDLGYEVGFAIDATHTFDQDDHDGGTVTADELGSSHGANLDPEFGRVLIGCRGDRRAARDRLMRSLLPANRGGYTRRRSEQSRLEGGPRIRRTAE